MTQDFEMRQQYKMQLDIIKTCFGDCANNFAAGELSSGEKTCLQNCAKRTMNTLMILGEAQQTFMSRQGGMNGQF